MYELVRVVRRAAAILINSIPRWDPFSGILVHTCKLAGLAAGARQPCARSKNKSALARQSGRQVQIQNHHELAYYWALNLVYSARIRKIFAFAAHSPESAFPDIQLFSHIHAPPTRTHCLTCRGPGACVMLRSWRPILAIDGSEARANWI